MDFILWNQSDKECALNKFNYKSDFNFNVMFNIFNYLNEGKISFIQFNWNNSKNLFESNKFAHIYFDSKNNKFNLKYVNIPLKKIIFQSQNKKYVEEFVKLEKKRNSDSFVTDSIWLKMKNMF